MMSEKIIQSKIKYFIDYWLDFTFSNSIEEQNETQDLITYNPRDLFKEFADDIKLNKQRKKKFFIARIKEFTNLSVESIKFLETNLTFIKQEFSNIQQQNPDCKYMLFLLGKINSQLSGNQFREKCIEELKNILTNEDELKEKKDTTIKKKIKILTRFIILELAHKKYSQESIIEFIKEKFQIDKDINENFVKINNLFKKESEEFTYIFPIQGFPLEKDAFEFENIKICKFNPPLFYAQKNDITYLGEVKLKVVDWRYGEKEAFLKLNKLIDVLSSSYDPYTIPINIKEKNTWLICEHGLSRQIDHRKQETCVSLEEPEKNEHLLEFYNEKITQINNPVDKKISDSLYWKRRAVQSLDNNEKILWFWMSIENLISTDLIFDKVSKFLAFEQLKEFASKHYDKLYNITEIGKERHFNKKIELSQELKKKLNLEHKSVNPEKFVDNIENIKKSLDEDELFSEQLDSLKDVFHNKKKCLDKLETFENLITTKLRYVYILRNKIVHSASNENNLLNDYYIDFISKASRDILWEFIKKRQINDLQTVDDILNEIMYDYDLLKDRVKKEGPQILLNIKN